MKGGAVNESIHGLEELKQEKGVEGTMIKNVSKEPPMFSIDNKEITRRARKQTESPVPFLPSLSHNGTLKLFYIDPSFKHFNGVFGVFENLKFKDFIKTCEQTKSGSKLDVRAVAIEFKDCIIAFTINDLLRVVKNGQ